jgi:putative MATE family efflux protein
MNAEEKALRVAENANLTRGPIAKKLVAFSLPIILGNLAQQLYNVVDSIVVGNFAANGTECIAAVNSSFAIMMVFNAVYMGIAMGANVIISQYKGAGNTEKLENTLTSTFSISMFVGLIITFLGLILTQPILNLLGTPANIMADSACYLRIVFIGTCGNIVYNGMNGMVRGLGDSKWPLYALLISSALNIVLDLIFVVVFHWDVAGVAWATIIAHTISGLILVIIQADGRYGAKINFKKLHKIDKDISKHILRLGTPSAVQSVAFSAGMLVTQRYSNMFGSDFLAANAIIMKVDGFAIMPMMGFSNAITTYVGQNIGAGDIFRVNKGIKITTIMAAVTSIVVGVILIIFGKYLMLAFGVNQHVLDMGIRGLQFLAMFYIFMAVQNVLGGAIRGAGDALTSAITSIVSTLIRIPIAYALAVIPLKRAINAAVESGLFASYDLAAAAGVGLDNYMGLFHSWAVGMVVGLLIIVPCFIFGKWREKGIVNKSKPKSKI